MRKSIIIVLFLLSACRYTSDSNILITPVSEWSKETSFVQSERLPVFLTPTLESKSTPIPTYSPTPDVIQTLLPGSTQSPTRVQEFEPEKWTIYHMGSDEFPMMMVHDIESGINGDIWVASSAGLSHFDGETWVTFTEEDGLIWDETFAVAVEESGAVWAGTRNGVSKYYGNTWHSYNTNDGLSGNHVRNMTIGDDGIVWFVTKEHNNGNPNDGVTSYDGKDWKDHSTESGFPSGAISRVVVDKKENVWIGTEQGITYYDGQKWQTYYRDDYWKTTYANLDNSVSQLALSPDGTLWFLTDNKGLTSFDGNQWQNIAHPSLFSWYLSSIAVTHNNEILICGGDGSKESERQLIMFSGTEWIDYDIPLTSWCFNVFVSRDGSIWIATEISLMRYQANE